MKKSISLLSICAGTMVLAACASEPVRTPVSRAQKSISQQEVLQGIEQIRSAQTYKLQPGDLINIQVVREESM